MQNKSVFILQDTKETCCEIASMFDADENFNVVGTSFDGESGLKEIIKLNPDFIITELVLCCYDGIKVLDEIVNANLKSKIIVLSALCREEIIAKAISHGANYFFAKPINFSILKERMLELDNGLDIREKSVSFEQQKIKKNLEEKISKIFINVGIPPHIKGYNFLREGVKMAVEDPSIIGSITKRLYPKIGERYDTTASKVERAIRHAIEVAWSRGRIESINGLFGVRAYVGSEKPTNGEFIALIADKMLLEMS